MPTTGHGAPDAPAVEDWRAVLRPVPALAVEDWRAALRPRPTRAVPRRAGRGDNANHPHGPRSA